MTNESTEVRLTRIEERMVARIALSDARFAVVDERAHRMEESVLSIQHIVGMMRDDVIAMTHTGVTMKEAMAGLHADIDGIHGQLSDLMAMNGSGPAHKVGAGRGTIMGAGGVGVAVATIVGVIVEKLLL